MQRSGTVLLVENNPDDARLAELAFERIHLAHFLKIVTDGVQAMDYLKGRGQYADRKEFSLPRLILLDLGMPGVSGFELLEQLRQDERLREVPVIVLSGTNYSRDVSRAYELGAKAFLEKSCDPGKFVAGIREMAEIWLSETPTRPTANRQLRHLISLQNPRPGSQQPWTDPGR